MIADPAFSDLIGRIYDCALDTGLWPAVLGEISDALDGQMGDIGISHPLESRQHLAFTHGWPDDLARLAIANAHLNPVLPLGLTLPLCEPFCKTRHMDADAYHRSRYWQTVFDGKGLGDYVVAPVTRTVTTFASWGIVVRPEKQAFLDADIELVRVLSPHIRRSVEIAGVLRHERVQSSTLRSALDAVAAAAFIIEPDGLIRYCNRAGKTELGRGTIVCGRRGRLVPVTSDASALVGVLASDTARRNQRGLDAFLTDAAGRTLHATWAELEQAGEEVGASILLLLREPEAALTTPLSSAAHLYRLTSAETQVLAQLLQGRPLHEVADILGVARSTVKSHLDALYRKTDTNRQAELVRAVMTLASPLRSSASSGPR